MSKAHNTQSRKICVGQFAAAHGVRGLVKLRSFTADPESIFTYAPLTAEDGQRTYKLTFKSTVKDFFIVAVEGINDKESADQLRGDRLYIAHDLLPKTGKNEYYEADLLGLSAVDASGKDYGKVLAIHDYGAGTFLEIGNSRRNSFMLPFKGAFVPNVDIADGKITLNIPEGWLSIDKD